MDLLEYILRLSIKTTDRGLNSLPEKPNTDSIIKAKLMQQPKLYFNLLGVPTHLQEHLNTNVQFPVTRETRMIEGWTRASRDSDQWPKSPNTKRGKGRGHKNPPSRSTSREDDRADNEPRPKWTTSNQLD